MSPDFMGIQVLNKDPNKSFQTSCKSVAVQSTQQDLEGEEEQEGPVTDIVFAHGQKSQTIYWLTLRGCLNVATRQRRDISDEWTVTAYDFRSKAIPASLFPVPNAQASIVLLYHDETAALFVDSGDLRVPIILEPYKQLHPLLGDSKNQELLLPDRRTSILLWSLDNTGVITLWSTRGV
eukprot:Blabericola_migrator_1__11733@NODE_70_length_15323_cov_105_367593_g63_i0_p8_GENE_NODE_70_length_15323_cov_105_367593_g63_i0NODE_70_length_15323_cov_105_367593_g63_i0_p8_ORF_typecomplete_len179_score33_64_NODE_70_length_15323_cov_105_367593_g63_i01417814714